MAKAARRVWNVSRVLERSRPGPFLAARGQGPQARRGQPHGSANAARHVALVGEAALGRGLRERGAAAADRREGALQAGPPGEGRGRTAKAPAEGAHEPLGREARERLEL